MKTPTDIIGSDLQTELEQLGKAVAEELFGDFNQDAEELTKNAFLDMVRRNWSDQGYRQGLAKRIGDEAFLDAAVAAGVLPDYHDALKALEKQGDENV